MAGRDPLRSRRRGGVGDWARGRHQPERLGREDREHTRRSQEPTGGGRVLLRRLRRHVSDLPVEAVRPSLHTDAEGSRALGTLLLVGGVLFVALHAVSDIGIYGVLDGKLAAFGAQHDHSVSYTLYLMTYAVDSVADVFGSLFAFAAGVLVFRSGVCRGGLGGSRSSPPPCSFCRPSDSVV